MHRNDDPDGKAAAVTGPETADDGEGIAAIGPEELWSAPMSRLMGEADRRFGAPGLADRWSAHARLRHAASADPGHVAPAGPDVAFRGDLMAGGTSGTPTAVYNGMSFGAFARSLGGGDLDDLVFAAVAYGASGRRDIADRLGEVGVAAAASQDLPGAISRLIGQDRIVIDETGGYAVAPA